jgi:hypothetical protein
VFDVGGCALLDGELTVRNTDGTVRTVRFKLSPTGWDEAARLSLALENAPIAPIAPCTSNCLQDGVSLWFSHVSSATESVQKFYYYETDLTPELRIVDAFVQGLIDQALVCKGEALESCFTFGGAGDPPRAPWCGDNQPIASSSCECPVSFEQLSTLDGEPCSATCGGCQVPDSTCGAYCVEPCVGQGPVWSVWCTE